MNNTSILIVTEGPDDKSILGNMLKAFKIVDEHKLYVFKTNIYCLYDVLERETEGDWDEIDLPLALRAHASSQSDKDMLSNHFSEIILSFDFDPQHPTYSYEKIVRLYDYFSDASDHGKLYLNYPMVEAAYHFISFPKDDKYKDRIVTKQQLENHEYKRIVDSESKQIRKLLDYSNIGVVKNTINLNLQKALYISGADYIHVEPYTYLLMNFKSILRMQAELYNKNGYIYILFTTIFYFLDYNSKLLN